ncbi:MAG TPA: MMPL family transporter [Chryseolinea sp.]|nr:MMPL family transporter [Chryseolinea sp.]
MFLIVVLLVIFGFFRTWQSVLIPFISLLVSLILMYGYAAFIGRTLNLSTLMYPTIIVVIGTSDLVHFYSKYVFLRANHNQWDAIHLTLHELRSVLFLTSFTTAIGFLTIATSTIPQVQQFGVDGVVGISIAFLVTIFLTPIVITWFPDPKTRQVHNIWLRLSTMVVKVTSHRNVLIALSSLGIAMLSIIGFLSINTNNKIIGNISEKHKLAIDFQFFESHYAGVRKIQFLIEPQKGMRWADQIILNQFNKFEEFITSLPESRYVLSNLTAVKSYNKGIHGGSWNYYTIPDDPKIISRFKKEYETRGMDFYGSGDTPNGYLVISLTDTGREQVEKTIANINHWTEQNMDASLVKIRISGNDLLIDKNNEYLAKEMFSSFGFAFVLIGLLMGWLFRNWIIVLISMAVNILPVLMTGGLMGFLGIPLSGTTAIIFTIGFVIAIDDTIHFMTRYKNELKIDPIRAIDNSIYSATQPIVITSIILVTGYLVPVFSTVREANYQGILIGATLLFAMLADLFLLPALLRFIKSE